jgi:hypothetical protein
MHIIAELLLLSLMTVVVVQIYTLRRTILATPPVTQQAFDAALGTLTSTIQGLVDTVGNVETGLTAVEAALTAAQGSSAPVDLSAELATVQNLQAEVATATAAAQAALASIPASPAPAPTTT